MQIGLKRRALDNKVEVWAEMDVTWGADPVAIAYNGAQERGGVVFPGGRSFPELGFKRTEPVLVEVLSPGERSVFWARLRESAPLPAGDGFGSSKDAATEALKS